MGTVTTPILGPVPIRAPMDASGSVIVSRIWTQFFNQILQALRTTTATGTFTGDDVETLRQLMDTIPTSVDTDEATILGMLTIGGEAPQVLVLYGTFATIPPAAAVPDGTLYVITDRTNIIYESQYVAGVPTWVYVSGTWSVMQNAIPAGLGTADANLLVWISDYSHMIQWTGSAWQRGPGDPDHSDTFQMFGLAPTDVGWHVCDGSTVNFIDYANPTVLGVRTLPTGPNAYPLLGLSYSDTVTAAVAPAVAVSPGVSSEPVTTAGATGTAAPVAHSHGTTTTLPGDPIANEPFILYYRQ